MMELSYEKYIYGYIDKDILTMDIMTILSYFFLDGS